MISIIVPTYNEEKYIVDFLDQFKAFTLPHEIIVSDDKSLDATVSIARHHVKAPQVLVPEAKHVSIAANRNAGARKATGDMFVFMDCDSRVDNPNQFFAQALSYFEKNPQLVALTVALRVERDKENFMDRIIYIIFNIVHIFKNNIFHTGEASGKFQMMPREAFLKVNGYREDLISREDADMFQRLAKIGRTSCETSLQVNISGRRAHAIGWPKLLWIWGRDSFTFFAKGSPVSKVWKDVR